MSYNETIIMIATIIAAIATVIGTCIAWRKRKGGSDDRKSGHHIEITGNENEVQTGESNINIKNNEGKINIQR